MNWAGLLSILWTITIIGLIFYILWWGFQKIPVPEPFKNIISIILIAATVFVAIALLVGQIPMIPFCQLGTVNVCM